MLTRRLVLLLLVFVVGTVLALPAGQGATGGALSRPKRNTATKTAAGTRIQQAVAAAQKRSNVKKKPTKRLNARAPQASKRMGQRKRGKLATPAAGKKDYSNFLCPGGSVACPVNDADPTTLQTQLNSVADWFRVGFECVDLQTELEQCGGCLSLGKGQDCSSIDNVKTASCEAGRCVVLSCTPGFAVNAARDACVAAGGNQAAFRRRR